MPCSSSAGLEAPRLVLLPIACFAARVVHTPTPTGEARCRGLPSMTSKYAMVHNLRDAISTQDPGRARLASNRHGPEIAAAPGHSALSAFASLVAEFDREMTVLGREHPVQNVGIVLRGPRQAETLVEHGRVMLPPRGVAILRQGSWGHDQQTSASRVLHPPQLAGAGRV